MRTGLLKQLLPYAFFAAAILGLTSRINLQQPMDLHTLVLRDVDEDAFQISMDRMWHGRQELNPLQSFSFGFYAYGRLFRLIPGIFGFPFRLQGNEAALIFIPRLISSVFALFSVVVIYRTLGMYLKRDQAFLGAGFILLMAGFRKNAFRFHPDHMMTFFALASIYCFAKDWRKFSTYFFIGVGMIGLALASKLAAILFLPVLAVYLIGGRFHGKITLLKALLSGWLSLLGICGVYVFFNPYVLHPTGFEAVKTQFFIDIYSNATNHGGDPTSITVLSIFKNVIKTYYLSRPVLFLFFLLGAVEIRRERGQNIPVLLSFSRLLLAAVYMPNFIHKERQHYYLFPLMFLPLLFAGLRSYKRWGKYIILLLILCLQVTQQKPHIRNEFIHYIRLSSQQSYKEALGRARRIEDFLANKKITTIMAPNELPVDYASLGIEMTNVRKLYGHLTEELVAGYKDPTRNVFFQTPDIIVLTKDLPLFNLAKEAEYKKTVTYPQLLASRAFYEKLVQGEKFTYAGTSYYYTKIADTNEFVILEKQPRQDAH